MLGILFRVLDDLQQLAQQRAMFGASKRGQSTLLTQPPDRDEAIAEITAAWRKPARR
jgi:hypothetical protein